MDTPTPKLNRSLTMAERRPGGTGLVGRRTRDPLSPLKRFTRAKESISKAFGLIRERLTESQVFFQLAREGAESRPVAALLERTQGIQDILSRDHMKVAFFGRTSNGKSSVINALLQSQVLPAGIGHTTNCFCSVVGSEADDGFVLTPGSNERLNVKNVKQLAHSLHKKHLEPSSLMKIFWPKAKCPLLGDDVEFVDSPGIDMNPNMDEWINKHCLDADVFVLVSNAESTLMIAEKNFFHRVSEHLSKPNIFILNNRWDASANEEFLDEVREQHLDCDIHFLTKELKVTDEATARNRVFFVSAKEVLQYRMRKQQNVPNPTEGLADGFKRRFLEFEQFERQFKECISSSAISTKFEHHHRQGATVVAELEELLQQESKNIQDNSELGSQQLQVSWQRQQTLHSDGERVAQTCQHTITSTAQAVEQKIFVAMKDIVSQLTAITDSYDHQFDLAHLEGYKQDLFQFMDDSLSQELNRVSTTMLGRIHQDTQKSLIDSYQQLLQLSEKELTRYSQLVRQPELSFVLRCADLCEDFQEDLHFHFSLGLSSVLRFLNVDSLLGAAQGQASRLWSLLPGDYALPIVLLGAGALFSRFLNWRYIVPSLALYGGIYSYEWLTWTDRSKETALKRQFVQHLRAKVQYQIRATVTSYTTQLTSNLTLLQHQLQGALGAAQERETGKIAELTEQQTRLTQLQDRAKKLRNAVHLLQQDLENFREDYLDQTD